MKSGPDLVEQHLSTCYEIVINILEEGVARGDFTVPDTAVSARAVLNAFGTF